MHKLTVKQMTQKKKVRLEPARDSGNPGIVMQKQKDVEQLKNA
jgi:hypothetical protein